MIADLPDACPRVDGNPQLQGACLYVVYVFLDNDARQHYAQNPHEYLIKQVQFTGCEGIPGNCPRFRLNFNHPTTELVWFTQEDDCVTQCASNPNLWHVGVGDTNPNRPENPFVYERRLGGNAWNCYEVADPAGPISAQLTPPLAGGLHINPMIDAKLQMNGQDRFSTRSGEYFNETQPYYHHTRVPESKGVFMYSFALDPEEHQPQGTANFSRLDTVTLQMRLRNINGTQGNPGKLYVFAVNYNFFRVAGGMGGLAFAA